MNRKLYNQSIITGAAVGLLNSERVECDGIKLKWHSTKNKVLNCPEPCKARDALDSFACCVCTVCSIIGSENGYLDVI